LKYCLRFHWPVSGKISCMIPRIIHFSVSQTISAAQSDIISVARQLHPDWDIKVWQDPVHDPDFRLSGYADRANSGAQRADLIRLDAIFKYGGIYLDTDVRLIRSLDPIAQRFSFFVCSENGLVATNAVFGAAPGHPAVGDMIGRLLTSPPDWSIAPNITTGPVYFSRMLQWREDVTVLPRETFYPYNWNEEPRSPHPQTYGIHEWEGSWKDEKSKSAPLLGAFAQKLRPRRILRGLYWRGRKLRETNEAVIRALPTLSGYSVADTLVRQTVHGHRILLSGEDLSITPEIMTHGYYELREELFLKRALAGGDYFVDIGANVGIYSLVAARAVGRFGRVFCYEPNPLVASLLRKSATMNWMHDRIVMRPVAVGPKPDRANLMFSGSHLGGATLVKAEETGSTAAFTRTFMGENEELEVDVVTLDDEFPVDIPIRILKIDAEGYEIGIFAGAERLLSNGCIDFIIFEAVPEVAGSSWNSLLSATSRVMQHGYELWKFQYNGEISPTSVREIELSGTGNSRNILLRRKGARL
jgi:FkbM family methyltransferase